MFALQTMIFYMKCGNFYFSSLCKRLAGELTDKIREPTHMVKGKCTNKSCDVIADLYHRYK